MDLVDYRRRSFRSDLPEFRKFAAQLQVPDLYFIPVSALHRRKHRHEERGMPWFDGASLLHYLETVHIASDRNLTEMRFPVQLVLAAESGVSRLAGHGFGDLKPGDPVMVLPSGRTSRVKSISTYDGELARAFPPMSVTVCLEDEVDISRGNMLVHPSHPPHVTRCLDVRLVWMGNQPLDLRKQYVVKHTNAVGESPGTLDTLSGKRQYAGEATGFGTAPQRNRSGGHRHPFATVRRSVSPESRHRQRDPGRPGIE